GRVKWVAQQRDQSSPTSPRPSPPQGRRGRIGSGFCMAAECVNAVAPHREDADGCDVRTSMGDETALDRRGLDRLLQLLESPHFDLAHPFARDAVLLRQIL